MTAPAEPTAEPQWHLVAERRAVPRRVAEVRPHRIYAAVLLMMLGVLVGVAVVGSYAAREQAESEAIVGASRRTELIADSVVEPALGDGVIAMTPDAEADLDRAVRDYVLGPSVVRVKLWTADGTIIYSDEQRLIGQRYPLGDDEREIILRGADGLGTGAEITDLDQPENVYERGQGKLLEVYHAVRTPSGQVLLLETYAPYDTVTMRSNEIWRGFALVMIGSLLALTLLMVPVLAFLLRRLRRGRDERERLLQAAIDASDTERRRIAATLHDGVVQELAATSYVVAASANRAREVGAPGLAASLSEAATAVRGGISGLRSLLVDIYPASLDGSGLTQALTDLVAGLRNREVTVHVDISPDATAALDAAQARLVFQVAQETVRNAAKHAQASNVWLSLTSESASVVLEVRDNGTGFDADQVLAEPLERHFGVRLLADAADRCGAGLAVATDVGSGTHWLLEVPTR